MTVLAKLSVGIRPKGEFETTAEYEHHMQALETNLALRTANYTFAIPESAVHVTYDADEALFTIVVKDVFAVEGKDRSILVVQLDGPETLRIHAEPQVARLAKGTMDVMVVGHARYESRERGDRAEWVGLYPRALHITRDEIVVVHRPSECVVGRPARQTVTGAPRDSLGVAVLWQDVAKGTVVRWGIRLRQIADDTTTLPYRTEHGRRSDYPDASNPRERVRVSSCSTASPAV